MRTPWPRSRRAVRGVGPRTARILLLGEAPGRDEVFWGEPFVGQAGQLQQDEGWAPVGIRREDVRLENVCEERPPGNRVEALLPRTVEWWQHHCRRRLDQFVDEAAEPVCLVPVGNLALATCLGDPLPLLTHGAKAGQWRIRKPAGIAWLHKITQYRGSLLEYTTKAGKVCRMIPTVHPASFLWHASGPGFAAWQGDWRRIAKEVAKGCPPVIEGDDRIAEEPGEVATWLREAIQVGEPIAIDLETAGALLLCFAVSQSGEDSLVVALIDSEGKPVKWGWFWLAAICASPLEKVFHNGLFDNYLLRWHKVRVVKWWWDTLAMHHLFDPSDRHTLAYCASRDLRTTFWKEESKEVEVGPRGGLKRKTAQWDQFLRYCGKDARHTIQLELKYECGLEDRGLLPLYKQHYRRVMHACLDLSLEGFLVDERERGRLHAEAMSKLERLRHAMQEHAGVALTTGPRVLKSGKTSTAKNQPKGGLSNPAILKYFYETKGIKPYMKGKVRTADVVALRRMQLRYPKKAEPVAGLIVEFRHQEKVAQFTAATRLDGDGRMRSLFRPLTTTGRLRAQTPPTGVGTNLQNQLRSIRSMFRARPGFLLAELDYSQAESRLVDGASGDPRALELARTPPLALDQHRLMASEVLAKAMEDVTKDERENVGKRGRHATNYGMEGVRMSDMLIKETEGRCVLTPEECDDIIAKVMAARPYIAKWQAWVRERIIRHRKLVNSYGRFLLFTGRDISKEDYKEGYAFGPQSDVGVLLTQEGWLPVWRRIKEEKLTSRVVHQGHDAFIIDGPVEELWSLVQMAVESMMVERAYPGVQGEWTLRMPVGLKVGTHWGSGMTEWKQAEEVTGDEFRAAARAHLDDQGRESLRAGRPVRSRGGAGGGDRGRQGAGVRL